MLRKHSTDITVSANLMQIGLEVVRVYGSEKTGYSMNDDDLRRAVPDECLYKSMDELYFALVNLNVGPEGRA